MNGFSNHQPFVQTLVDRISQLQKCVSQVFRKGQKGLGAIVLRHPDGTVSGATVDTPYSNSGVAVLFDNFSKSIPRPSGRSK